MKKKPEAQPCPYCKDPAAMFAPPKGRPTEETVLVVNTAGRFWASVPGLLAAHKYGPRYVTEVPPEYLGERFKAFTVRLLGVDVSFSEAGPPPFTSSVAHHVVARPDVPSPARGALPSVALTQFSACVIEGEGVRLEAHWWPSHDWIVNHTFRLTKHDPEGRNAQLEAAGRAVEFFQLEARGAPKITEARIREALEVIGPSATLIEAARVLRVSESALEKWRQRHKIGTWREVVSRLSPMP
jgi:hypothetical protein